MVGIIGIFFVLAIIGAMLPSSSHSTSASTATTGVTPTSDSVVSTPTQNSNVCQWDWTSGTTQNIGSYYTASAGYEYVIVQIYLKNNAEQSVSTNPFYWSLVADGIKYTQDASSYSDVINHQTVDVSKGGELETKLSYLVKGNPTTAELSYSGFGAPEMQRINHYKSAS